MKKYKIIAKDDLNAFPHTWTKGLDYEIEEHVRHITLASNEGQVNYINEVKDDVLSNFETV